ncbi:MAG: hypothetical protein AB3N28_01895 [Kordiimonas sp.]
MSKFSVILDCYTDEPSGYGVPPYIGTHQLHLSQALAHTKNEHFYLTIDDLREEEECSSATNKRIANRTKNYPEAAKLLKEADTIFIICGCFVDYEYFCAEPPKAEEILNAISDSAATKVLFFVMGNTKRSDLDPGFQKLASLVDVVKYGNTYRTILEPASAGHLLDPNYQALEEISRTPAPLLEQIDRDLIVEIETGTGCNTPFCTFCIEAARAPKVTYREPQSIVAQVSTFYSQGVRRFRLGRQPNFFHYQNASCDKLEELLLGIRSSCPTIKTLHIDNVNIINVIGKVGKRFTQLVASHCTSGNIAPFGIESFDNNVRQLNGVVGSADQVLRAVEIINEYGSQRGEDGYPRFLPGVNLIHGLKGHSERSHEENLRNLGKIYELGLQTRRLYYRPVASNEGTTFSNNHTNMSQYESERQDIVSEFVIPMQERVFPAGTILKGLTDFYYKEGSTYLRSVGTCPPRVRIADEMVKPSFDGVDVRINSSAGERLLDAGLVNQ